MSFHGVHDTCLYRLSLFILEDSGFLSLGSSQKNRCQTTGWKWTQPAQFFSPSFPLPASLPVSVTLRPTPHCLPQLFSPFCPGRLSHVGAVMHQEQGRIKVKYLKKDSLSRNQEEGTERPHCAGNRKWCEGAKSLGGSCHESSCCVILLCYTARGRLKWNKTSRKLAGDHCHTKGFGPLGPRETKNSPSGMRKMPFKALDGLQMYNPSAGVQPSANETFAEPSVTSCLNPVSENSHRGA